MGHRRKKTRSAFGLSEQEKEQYLPRGSAGPPPKAQKVPTSYVRWRSPMVVRPPERLRYALSQSQSHKLLRQTSDLRLLDWQRYGWKLPDLGVDVVSTRGVSGSTSRGVESNSDKLSVKREKESIETSITIRSLPSLPRNGLGQPMLRRPPVRTPRPIRQSGDLFGLIIKGRELMPYSFQGNVPKADQFYASHYPLLLRKLQETSLPTSATVVTESDVKENLRYTSTERRSQEIFQRLCKVEESLAKLEKEDEEPLYTELRDMVFNPHTWPWNKDRYIFQ